MKGTISELCRVRGIGKATLFDKREGKVSFNQSLRGMLPGAESAYCSGCPGQEAGVSKVAETFSGLGCCVCLCSVEGSHGP